MIEIERYSLLGRIVSAIRTFKETHWTEDNYKFTFKEKCLRTIRNFRDMPTHARRK